MSKLSTRVKMSTEGSAAVMLLVVTDSLVASPESGDFGPSPQVELHSTREEIGALWLC